MITQREDVNGNISRVVQGIVMKQYLKCLGVLFIIFNENVIKYICLAILFSVTTFLSFYVDKRKCLRHVLKVDAF